MIALLLHVAVNKWLLRRITLRIARTGWAKKRDLNHAAIILSNLD